jgi:hypothetical protein
MKNKANTSDGWFLYRRQGKTRFDQLIIFIVIGFIILFYLLNVSDRIQYPFGSNSKSAPSVIFFVILLIMILILIILLFPIGYGRIIITDRQIQIVPPAYLNFLPFKETLDLNDNIVIRYFPRNNLLKFKTDTNFCYLKLNGVNKSFIDDILMRIKHLSIKHKNIRYYVHGKK